MFLSDFGDPLHNNKCISDIKPCERFSSIIRDSNNYQSHNCG